MGGRRFGALQREKVAWRFGYADALLGHEPTVDVWPGVAPEYRAAYMAGRKAAVDAGRFGSSSQHRPALALRAAVLRQELEPRVGGIPGDGWSPGRVPSISD